MDIVILLVRLLFSALLYVFLGTLFFFLWRDVKQAARHQISPAVRERPGQLRVLRGYNGINEGTLLALTAFTTIGRSDNNSITITDPIRLERACPAHLAQRAMVAGRSR